MKHIWLIDSTGREWWSDPDTDGEITPELEAQVVETFKDLSDVSSLSILVGGVTHWFNPAHVIAWSIKDKDGDA